jgi:hypothetical protein
MKRGEVEALYGMAGSGKSVVAADVVSSEEGKKFVKKTFPGGVYWVSVGQVSKELLLGMMLQLYERFLDGANVVEQSPRV